MSHIQATTLHVANNTQTVSKVPVVEQSNMAALRMCQCICINVASHGIYIDELCGVPCRGNEQLLFVTVVGATVFR